MKVWGSVRGIPEGGYIGLFDRRRSSDVPSLQQAQRDRGEDFEFGGDASPLSKARGMTNEETNGVWLRWTGGERTITAKLYTGVARLRPPEGDKLRQGQRGETSFPIRRVRSGCVQVCGGCPGTTIERERRLS